MCTTRRRFVDIDRTQTVLLNYVLCKNQFRFGAIMARDNDQMLQPFSATDVLQCLRLEKTLYPINVLLGCWLRSWLFKIMCQHKTFFNAVNDCFYLWYLIHCHLLLCRPRFLFSLPQFPFGEQEWKSGKTNRINLCCEPGLIESDWQNSLKSFVCCLSCLHLAAAHHFWKTVNCPSAKGSFNCFRTYVQIRLFTLLP